MDTGAVSGGQCGRGLAMTTHPHLGPWLRMGWTVPVHLFFVLMSCYGEISERLNWNSKPALASELTLTVTIQWGQWEQYSGRRACVRYLDSAREWNFKTISLCWRLVFQFIRILVKCTFRMNIHSNLPLFFQGCIRKLCCPLWQLVVMEDSKWGVYNLYVNNIHMYYFPLAQMYPLCFMKRMTFMCRVST